jgi:hypothetical protein
MNGRKICGLRKRFTKQSLHIIAGHTNVYLHKLTEDKKGKGYRPEGSRKLKFPDFITTAQDGGKVVSLTHLPPLPPGDIPGTHFC